ncbi:MAG: hypothetical protein Q8L57_01020, partial [bacterium]|nr:hypothetical protein [bacterium]
MAEKELKDMTEEEMLEEVKKLKQEADNLLVAVMKIEDQLEHDYITPREEAERYAEIFKKSQELQDKKTELIGEALKKKYRRVLALLKFCKPVK